MTSTTHQDQMRVTYVYDEDLGNATTSIPNIKNRNLVVHELIKAYGLTDRMNWIPSQIASDDDVLSCHSRSYWDFLGNGTSKMDEEEENEKDSTEFGLGNCELGYDCPIFQDMTTFARIIVGGTLTAVEALLSGDQIAINWCGGWHHAQRDSASGFCYVNDIVIGIQRLYSKFKKILYIDLDAHHGDGVENAFSFSKQIFTLSLHNYEPGYFPGTGSVTDVGFGRGKYHSLNVPLKSGIDDSNYVEIFSRVFELVQTKFIPEAVVVQCGADGLAGDPLGNSNLTEKSLGSCVVQVLKLQVPTLFLGGGGYNIPNSARCWTYLTSLICGYDLSNDIPEHDFFPLYGPGFDLHITPTLRKNESSLEYEADLFTQIKENIDKINN